MKIDENWFKVYEEIYGESFNRLLTIGNNQNGYINHNIQGLKELRKLMEEFPNNEYYISLYNYITDENILRWNTNNLNKYEEHAEKNYIMLRFIQNSDVIQEEVVSLSEIQKFMFIRRSINLGLNKEIIKETEKTYNFFKTHFNIKGTLIFNGYTETLLIIPVDELKLNNPSLTYYNILKLLQKKLELKTLVYENIEPYAQLMPLPGTQNKHSRLYVQLYHPGESYKEIMKNSQNKFFKSDFIKAGKKSEKLHSFIHDIDDEIMNNKNRAKYDFEEIWNNI